MDTKKILNYLRLGSLNRGITKQDILTVVVLFILLRIIMYALNPTTTGSQSLSFLNHL
ncbi:MAG: hypothetical protein ACLQG5_00655 [Methanobacterium sp.]